MSSKKKNLNLIDWYLQVSEETIKKYGNSSLVMMEVGSFYELYAVTESELNHIQRASNIMSIRITKKKNNTYMAGITSIALDKYIKMLLPHGYNIVIINQVTSPPNPKREIVKVYSPSTNLDVVGPDTDNYLLSIVIEGYDSNKNTKKLYSIGMSFVDISTGKSYCCEFHDDIKNGVNSISEAYRLIYGFKPTEIIIENINSELGNISERLSLSSNNVYIDKYKLAQNKKYFDFAYQENLIRDHFKCPGPISPHDYIGLDLKHHATLSLMLSLEFLDVHDKDISKSLQIPQNIGSSERLLISYTAMETLDIIPKGPYVPKKQSLLGLIDNCNTVLGKRLLKNRLMNPICNIEKLNQRYDLTEMVGNHINYLVDLIKPILDIDRLHRKMGLGKCSVSDFWSLDNAYNIVIKIFDFLDKNISITKILNVATKTKEKFSDFYKEYNKIIDIKQLISSDKYNIFNPGHFPEIDTLTNEIDISNKNLEEFRKLLCLITDNTSFIYTIKGIPDVINQKINTYLRLEKNDRDGYYFKITKNRCKILKKNLQKIFEGGKLEKYSFNKQLSLYLEHLNSLVYNDKKNEVNITCHWSDNISKSLEYSLNKLNNLISTEFSNQQKKWMDTYSIEFSKISELIAEIDISCSNFTISKKYSYIRPTIIDNKNSGVVASGLRHALTERINTDILFVPNPVDIGGISKDNIYSAVITGLNGVGKSIYIKSIALSVIMAQSGLYVPADQYKISLYNKLYTRIGNSDNLFKGQSTFYREMLELDTILRNADTNTLVIADELCAGSESASAQAILATTIETLNNKKCSNLITTHFHDSLKLECINKLDSVQYYHFTVTYKEGNLIYNRKLEKGLGPELYGIEVSKNIIGCKLFTEKCFEYRKLLLHNNKDKYKTSKYNKLVTVKKCEICNKTAEYNGELHTHHINEQVKANCNGNIGHISKNTKGNLVVLCQKHHIEVHDNKIIINGWKQSTENGLYLDYNYNNIMNKKNKKKKYTQTQIQTVLNLKGKMSQSVAKLNLSNIKDMEKISISIIKKIWNGTY